MSHDLHPGHETMDTANAFFENLRLLCKRLLTFVKPTKWQLVSDTKWSNLVLFTSLAKRRNVVHARTHEEVHVPLPSKHCGNTHPAGNCHAYGKACAKCNKTNHLAKVCQSTFKQDSKKSKPEKKKPGKHQRVNQLQQDQPPDELCPDERIFTLHTPKKDEKQYVASVLVSANKEQKPVPAKFQVDTGALCSTLTLRDYKRITSTIPDQSDTKLKLYDQSVIHLVGSTKLYCTVNDLTKKVHFEIVEHASTSLLSGRASEALQVIHFNQEYLMKVNSSSDPPHLNQEQVLHEHRDVFSGLG